MMVSFRELISKVCLWTLCPGEMVPVQKGKMEILELMKTDSGLPHLADQLALATYSQNCHQEHSLRNTPAPPPNHTQSLLVRW